MAYSPEQLRQPDGLPPIPEPAPLDGWKEVPIVETELSKEPLVPVGIFSDYRKIVSSSVYADEHHNSPYSDGLNGSNIAVLLREGVARKLEAATEMLPYGHHLMVMDGHRTLEVQDALYKQYEGGLREKYPDWTDKELSTETQKYVSLASHDETRPSPHNTGAAVDVVIIKVDNDIQREIDTIDSNLDKLGKESWQRQYLLEMKRSELIRRHGKMLNFGTRFDYGGAESALRYYEEKTDEELTESDKEARNNRRLLYDIMVKSGFEPFESEWWHYNDPASQMGAKTAGRAYAEYGAIQMSEENKEYEKMRKNHHLNSVRLAQGEEWTPPKGLEVHYKLARAAIFGNNPKHIWRMKDTVAKIEPPKDDIAA